MNMSKVRGRIVELYGTITEFAKVIGNSRRTISDYMRGARYLRVDEVLRWCEVLDIKEKDIPAYFFVKEVE